MSQAIPDKYRDLFGNWCTRLVAPAGRFVLSTDTVIRDSGALDIVVPTAPQTPVEYLPESTLLYLLGSRYCETDLLSDFAWQRFGSASISLDGARFSKCHWERKARSDSGKRREAANLSDCLCWRRLKFNRHVLPVSGGRTGAHDWRRSGRPWQHTG